MAIILWALSIASDARDSYGSLLAVGVAALIFWQAAINVGMVIGMLPVVGLTSTPLFLWRDQLSHRDGCAGLIMGGGSAKKDWYRDH